jgi:hypothetical protein
VTAAAAGTHELARWRHRGVGLVGLVAACAVQHGLPFPTVALHAEGLSPAAVGLLVSTPTAGTAAAAPAVGVVPARAVEAASRGAPPAVGAAAGR